jgi:hypothetical protein
METKAVKSRPPFIDCGIVPFYPRNFDNPITIQRENSVLRPARLDNRITIERAIPARTLCLHNSVLSRATFVLSTIPSAGSAPRTVSAT